MIVRRHQLVWFVLLAGVLIAAVAVYGGVGSVWFSVTNAVIIVFSLAGMASYGDRVFSLEKAVYVFFCFFFGLIPISDRYQEVLYLGGGGLSQKRLMCGQIYTWL